MKRGRRALIALVVAILVVAVLGIAVVQSKRSLIIIENRSDATLNLSVSTVNPSPFSWAGDLAPGRRAIRTARLSDNSFVVVCRDADGIYRTRGGYVTSGLLQRVDIVADGCGAVLIDIRPIP